MAVNAIIQRMTAAGLPATMELEGGKWCHTPEYLKYRYGARKASPDMPVKQKPAATSTFNRILKRLEQELTPTERRLLIVQLEAE